MSNAADPPNDDRPMFAMLTRSGTAMSETALCEVHHAEPSAITKAVFAAVRSLDHGELEWHDCTGNVELACIICGSTTYGPESLS